MPKHSDRAEILLPRSSALCAELPWNQFCILQHTHYRARLDEDGAVSLRGIWIILRTCPRIESSYRGLSELAVQCTFGTSFNLQEFEIHRPIFDRASLNLRKVLVSMALLVFRAFLDVWYIYRNFRGSQSLATILHHWMSLDLRDTLVSPFSFSVSLVLYYIAKPRCVTNSNND